MELQTFLFYFLSFICISGGLGVLLHHDPLFSSLFLAATMLGLAGLFFLLEAWFLAGVQIIVYAGAVMTLFIMVIMLFNLSDKKEKKPMYAQTKYFIKIFVMGWFCSLISLSGVMSVDLIRAKNNTKLGIMELAQALFTKYILVFEVLGVLLLMVAIAVVTITRSEEETN